jgi:hypothetical protein
VVAVTALVVVMLMVMRVFVLVKYMHAVLNAVADCLNLVLWVLPVRFKAQLFGGKVEADAAVALGLRDFVLDF